LAIEAPSHETRPCTKVLLQGACVRQWVLFCQPLYSDLHDKDSDIAPAAIETRGRHAGTLSDIFHVESAVYNIERIAQALRVEAASLLQDHKS
jgi:hypothetical protein